MEQFRRKGGNVVVKRLECFEELASDFDVIINCSGIGAKELANDLSVHPIRGHIFRVSLSLSCCNGTNIFFTLNSCRTRR